MVPFLVSGVYGLVLWAQQGLSALLPSVVYLDVTRSPYVFIAGSFAVMAGLVIELRGVEPSRRPAKLSSLGSMLQTVAIASLVLALLAAVYANGLNLGGAASDFIVGRYALVFPAVMILLSFLLTAQFSFSSLANRKVLALVALLLVPVSLREIGKHQIMVGLAVAFLLLIVGVAGYLLPQKAAQPQKQE